MQSYAAARSLFTILSVLSWCVIVIGVVALFGGLAAVEQVGRSFRNTPSAAAYLTSLLPGAGLSFCGFIGVVMAQIGRSGVDSAEYAQQSLAVAREQLEISRQSLRQSTKGEAGYAALEDAKAEITGQAAAPAPAPPSHSVAIPEPARAALHRPGESIDYRGKIIEVTDTGYRFAEIEFKTLDLARASIDRFATPRPQPQEVPPPGSADGALGATRLSDQRSS